MSYILGGDVYTGNDGALGCSLQSSMATGSVTLTTDSISVNEKHYQIVGFTLLVLDTRKEVPANVKNRVIWMSGILTDVVERGQQIDKTNYILKFAEEINKVKNISATANFQIELQEQFRYEVKR